MIFFLYYALPAAGTLCVVTSAIAGFTVKQAKEDEVVEDLESGSCKSPRCGVYMMDTFSDDESELETEYTDTPGPLPPRIPAPPRLINPRRSTLKKLDQAITPGFSAFFNGRNSFVKIQTPLEPKLLLPKSSRTASVMSCFGDTSRSVLSDIPLTPIHGL